MNIDNITKADTRICEVCNGESCTSAVGVASIPGVPISILWGNICISRDTCPTYVFDCDIDTVHGDLDKLIPWARERETWYKGKYMDMVTYMKAREDDKPANPSSQEKP